VRWNGTERGAAGPAGANVAIIGLFSAKDKTFGAGKAREVGRACREGGVDVAVLANPLTDLQRSFLADMLGCPVVTGNDLVTPGR
jgi:50S ribosomal subunit-associated GTPase HflX